MGTGLELGFDAFIEFHFDRVVGKPWYFEFDGDWWQPEPRSGIAHLGRLFSDGPRILEWFHDDQIAQGLTGLVNTMAIGDQPWMRDPVTPAEDRAEVWRSIANFFCEVLAPRCEPSLGHLAKAMPPAINTVTYMWWESFPGFTNPDDPKRALVDDAELAALEAILALDSVACQEAALHGLGHWVRREPRCEAIIDRYIDAGRAVLPELGAYAKAARCGCIL
jgi:hypothetical protein